MSAGAGAVADDGEEDHVLHLQLLSLLKTEVKVEEPPELFIFVCDSFLSVLMKCLMKILAKITLCHSSLEMRMWRCNTI